MVYRVRREQNKVEVIQNGVVVYSGAGDEYVVFKESSDATKLTVKTIREMSDPEILLALATAVRIPSMVRHDLESEL